MKIRLAVTIDVDSREWRHGAGTPRQTRAEIYEQVIEEVIGLLEASRLDDPYGLMSFTYRSGSPHVRRYHRNGEALMPNAEIREAVLKSGVACNEVARRAEMDEARLRRALGIVEQRGAYQHQITPTLAARIVRALGYDPRDFDL